MTLFILLITISVSVAAFYRRQVFDSLKFNAALIQDAREGWRFLTYGLVHADWMHLAVNMFVLYNFGPVVEAAFRYNFGAKGVFYYVLLYVGALAISVAPAYARHKNDVFYNAVGASGAVSAVVFSLILFYPGLTLRLFFLPVDFPAVLFGVAYLVYSWYMARKGEGPVGHDAHFWGGVFGFVFTFALSPRLLSEFIRQLPHIF